MAFKLLKYIYIYKNKKYHLFLCLLPLQRNSDLASGTPGFLSSRSAAANLHLIHETITLTYASIDKPNLRLSNSRYILIVERF